MHLSVETRGGAEITLDVDFTTFGQYRPARIWGDPASCHEAEYPEIEVSSDAQLRLKNGKWISYDLEKLDQATLDRIYTYLTTENEESI